MDLYVKYQLNKYPSSIAQDIYKQLYQATFGVNHLINNLEEAKTYISEELKTDQNNNDLYDVISPNFVRVNLNKYYDLGFDLDYLVDSFAKSTQDNPLYDFKALVSYFNLPSFDYKPVHHSLEYNKAYHPHYRVIKKEFITFEMKRAQLENYIKNINTPCILSLEGKCASGKTTITNGINSALIIHIDDFFLPPERKTKNRLLEIGGNIDYEAIKELLLNIRNKHTVCYKKYDCSTNKYIDVSLEYKDIIVLEGVYSYHPYFNNLVDKLIYLDVGEEVQISRISKRKNHDRFINEWIPLENKYYKESKILDQIDLII